MASATTAAGSEIVENRLLARAVGARVRELVRDLREAGQQRDLMTAVLRALELDELRRDERFQTSLARMRRGERA